MKTVGTLLRDRRDELGYSLSKVSKATKIPLEHLTSIETGNWQTFASSAFVQGVVHKYARFLQTDIGTVSAMLRRELVEGKVNFILQPSYREKKTWAFRSIALVCGLVLFIGYFILQFFFFLQQPTLRIQPTPNRISVSKPFVVSGQTEKGALVYLNDERIYQDTNGAFREEMYLKKGTRTIKIKVIGTNGTITTKQLIVTVVD